MDLVAIGEILGNIFGIGGTAATILKIVMVLGFGALFFVIKREYQKWKNKQAKKASDAQAIKDAQGAIKENEKQDTQAAKDEESIDDWRRRKRNGNEG